MNHPFDTRSELDECSELSDSRDRPFDRGAHGKSLLNIRPRMLFGVLQRKADLARRFGDPFDAHADLLPFLHDFARMLHALPGELADMNQPIHAAHIDKRAEVVNLS